MKNKQLSACQGLSKHVWKYESRQVRGRNVYRCLFICLFVCLFEEKKDRPSKDAFSKVPSKLRIVGQFLFSGQNERCKGES